MSLTSTTTRARTGGDKFTALALTLCLGASIGLSGCGNAPVKPDPHAGVEPYSIDIEDIRSLLERARNSASPQREEHYLQAAELLHLKGESFWARDLLEAIDPALLDDARVIQYTSLFSELAMDSNAYFLAQRILTNPRLEQQWQTLPAATARPLRERRAQLLALIGEVSASVRERLQLAPLLTDQAAVEQNQDAIWQTLMSLPHQELQHLENQSQNPLLRGWYSLAALSKDNQTDMERQQSQVDQWIARWPEHPASLRLPNDLQLLRQLIDTKPSQIALLLPQRGHLAKAGNAIRDGFFAAYYQAVTQLSQTPEIRVYDTSDGDISSLYQQAVNEGAQLVVGPLDKDRVAQLNQNAELPVPTLAMNYIEPPPQMALNQPMTPLQTDTLGPLEAPPEGLYDNEIPGYAQGLGQSPGPRREYAGQLYQFGLAVEDEARQTARRAWLEGRRHAMILAPQSDWGRRSADAFREAWHDLGGDLATTANYSGQTDLSQVIERALLLHQSQDRARDLRQLFGQRLEFEPRRRDDIDMIFLIANPAQARQIKPTLAYHYAGKLPVYATSHLYAGVEDRKNNRDLNGIKFSTLPWVLDRESPEKRAIDDNVRVDPVYNRLYALGVDAYRLYPRLQQLQRVNGLRLYGATGALHLTPERRVEREQVWAQMRGGRAQPLPAVVSGH